ncbi:hypothetical protein C3943_17840 [Lysinibacillus sp. B2A1]|nr:hypothetical protein C3943_17840 [Lysinibacillus sp. B2A1]
MEQINTEHGIFTNNEETGKAANEVYQEWLLKNLKPSNREIAAAELEITIITLLTELEVI